jgi:hypothetical protein
MKRFSGKELLWPDNDKDEKNVSAFGLKTGGGFLHLKEKMQLVFFQ